MATPTGRLRAALLVRPSPAIENAAAVDRRTGSGLRTRARAARRAAAKRSSTLAWKRPSSSRAAPILTRRAPAMRASSFEDGAALMRLTSLSRRAEVDRMEARVREDGRAARRTHRRAGVARRQRRPAWRGGRPSSESVRGGNRARAQRFRAARARSRLSRRRSEARRRRAVAAGGCGRGVERIRSCSGPIKSISRLSPAFVRSHSSSAKRRPQACCALSDGHVLAELRFRTALSAMRRAGITVEAIDLYEFTKLGLTPSMLTLALRRE